MSTTTTIHLVRHGQTILNREVRFRGRRDVPLNRIGRQEAIAAGRSLAGADLEAVYSSPLGRALEVGTAIAAASGLEDVVPLDDFVNVDYGRWEGLTKEESEEVDAVAWELYLNDPATAHCPGGESLVAAGDRVVRGLQTIGANHPGAAVAAVSHGVMLRLAVLHTAGLITEDWQFKISTGGSLVFEVTDGVVKLASGIPGETLINQ
ncbi:MAG: Alpha-ribazole-5-phosphate phosphatase [Thermoleophilia bacterium]|nr:Alpha-ribazole-5-phosphate phosphatase [Thermoleophilia bacterium]